MKRLGLTALLGVLLGAWVNAQGALSNQVLQLLTRQNTWTAANTFLNLRLVAGVPSDTALRFYVDAVGNLYFNGNLVAGAIGGGAPHNLLSSTHPDTVAGAVVRGDVIVGNSTPAWAALLPTVTGSILEFNGTDTVFSTSGAALTSLPAAQLTGTASAINGSLIQFLNASALSSGTVPLAQLSGITNTQIDPAASIAYSKLSLTGSVLNADISATAGIAYSKLNLAGAIKTSDITAATILFSNWASNSCTNLQVPQYNGAAWVCKTLVASDISGGGGTVTSVALTVPAIMAVGGSPVTTAGTLAVTLATETANTVWAGATSGGAATPTFRALVNADLPTSAVTPGTYPKVTVNQQGIVTSGSATIALGTDATGVLGYTLGGTGNSTAVLNTVLVGTGTGWTAQTLPNCTSVALQFTTASSAFSCPGTLGSFGASTVGTSTVGTSAAPFASAILGTAVTNNLTITPATYAQATTATVDDPGLAAVKAPLVRRGTIAYTAGALSGGTCSSAVTATVTGLVTTSTVTASLPGAVPTQWQKGIYFLAYPTANTVNIVVCNPTAGSITPDTVTLNYTAFVP